MPRDDGMGMTARWVTVAEAQLVDETIAYWRVRGVCAVDVGAALRCHRSWPVIRERMIAWLRRDEPEERRAA